MTAEHLAIDNYACPHCLAVFRTAFKRCPLDGNPLEPLVGDPLSGTSFADRYIIEECVGEGGMGRVYRARHQRMSRLFAVKVLFGDHAADQKMQARLAREAEAASRLSHPNVISVLDFGETDAGLLYLVMDYVDGPTLAQLIEQQAPIHSDRIRRLVRDMARGLAHAHKRGLIHRDFKADNVIISTDGADEVAKIVDFGIAMLNEPNKSRKLTTEGMVLGTPAVMAPEQAVGEHVDHRTDLFSLGIVIYEMLCGKLPFDGSPLEIAQQNLGSAIPSIAQRVPGLFVDPGLEAIATRLMQKKPEDRFQSAKEVLRELSLLEGGTSREFMRSEGHFLAKAGLDPMTPIPAAMAPVRLAPSGPVYFDTARDVPQRSMALGATEAIDRVSQPRRNSAWLIPVLSVAVIAVVVAIVAFSGGATQEEEPGKATAVAPIPTGTDTDPTGAVTDPTGADTDPAVADTDPAVADTDPAVADTDPAVADTDPAVAKTDLRRLAAQKKRALEKQERRESRRREKLEKERKRAEAKRNANSTDANSTDGPGEKPDVEEVTMGKFERALTRTSAALNQLNKVDKVAVGPMRTRLQQIQSSYSLATSDEGIRKKFIRELNTIRKKALAKIAAKAAQ